MRKWGACGEGGKKKEFDETCAGGEGVGCGSAVKRGGKCGVPRVGLDGWGVEEGNGVGGGDEEG